MHERPRERCGLRVRGGLHRDLECRDRGVAVAQQGMQAGHPRVGRDAGAQGGEPIGCLDGAIVVAQLHRGVGEVRPAHPVARLADDRLLGECAGREELVLAEQHPGLGPLRREVVGRDAERPIDRGARVAVPGRVAGLACVPHGATRDLEQLRQAGRGGLPLPPDGDREEGQEAGEREENEEDACRSPAWSETGCHAGSPGSRCRRLRPSYGSGTKGKSGVMPSSPTPTPSPTKFWMNTGPPATRTTMSVTSSFGRRPLGKPAGSGVGPPTASCAKGPRRLICAGGVGGTVRSSRSSSESVPPFCPGYLSRTPTTSSRGVGGTGTPATAPRAAATSRSWYAPRNCASSAGSVAFQKSLRPMRMISSFTSGLPMRETCTKSLLPLSNGRSSRTRPGSPARRVISWRDVLA